MKISTLYVKHKCQQNITSFTYFFKQCKCKFIQSHNQLLKKKPNISDYIHVKSVIKCDKKINIFVLL